MSLVPTLFAFTLLAHAESPTASVQTVESHYAAVKQMSATFTQVVKNPLYGDDTQTGTVQFSRPGKMRWTFTEDGKQYISDGQQLWIFVPEDQAAYHHASFDPGGTPQALLHSLDHLDELFTVTAVAGAEAPTFDLIPKADQGVVSIRLELAKDLTVRRVTLRDAGDTVTELTFTEVNLSPEIPEDIYRFTAPAGVSVTEVGALQ